MKIPAKARSSIDISSRLFPLYVIEPLVTKKLSRPVIMLARVLFPEPFRHIIACNSPGFMERLIPFKISFPSTLACIFLIINIRSV